MTDFSFTLNAEPDITQAPAVVSDLGYGSDLSCGADLDVEMSEVDPFSTRALGQAIVRRLDCPRGGLPDDPSYGIDLRGYLNRGVTADDIRALASVIRSELSKDDRIDTVRVTVRPSATGDTLRIELFVVPIDPRIGGFSLTMLVTDAATLIEEINGDA